MRLKGRDGGEKVKSKYTQKEMRAMMEWHMKQLEVICTKLRNNRTEQGRRRRSDDSA
jgi:hypothetical protein